jgi:hypothetical protein
MNLTEQRQLDIIHDLLVIYIERRHKLLSRKFMWPMFMSTSAHEELKDLENKIDKLHWDWAFINGIDPITQMNQAMKIIHEIEATMATLRRKLDDNDNDNSQGTSGSETH